MKRKLMLALALASLALAARSNGAENHQPLPVAHTGLPAMRWPEKGKVTHGKGWSQTPTGKGLLCASAGSSRRSKRPCSSDISPVYQYPSTNSSRKGTVM